MDRMCLTLWRFCRFCQKWKRSLDFLATSAAASQIHMRMQDAASCQMCVWYFAKHKHNIAGKEHKTSLKLQCTCIEPSHFQGPSHVIHVSWMRKTQKPKNGNYSIPHVGFNRIFCNGCISHLYIFLFSELETFDEGCQPAQSAASFDPGQKLFQKLFPFVPSATDLLGRILLKQHKSSQIPMVWTASGFLVESCKSLCGRAGSDISLNLEDSLPHLYLLHLQISPDTHQFYIMGNHKTCFIHRLNIW